MQVCELQTYHLGKPCTAVLSRTCTNAPFMCMLHRDAHHAHKSHDPEPQYIKPQHIMSHLVTPLSACSAAPADEKGKFDEVVEEHGVRILIEPAALMHVIGTTMDFVEDRIK